MIELVPTKEQKEEAKDFYPFKVLKNSITKGRRNGIGALGEIVFRDFMIGKGHKVQYCGDYDYDLMIDSIKSEVKTKATNFTPRDHYLCSVAKYNTSQECQRYIFVRVKYDMSKAWVLGWLSKKEFYEKAFTADEDEVDPESSPGQNDFSFTADCHNIKISKLNKFRR